MAKYLVDHHRFIARNTLPRTPIPGARVVVVPMNALASYRDRMTFARRVEKLGGVVVWLDQHVVDMEVTLPDPVVTGCPTPGLWEKRVAAFEASANTLVRMLEAVERV